MIHFDIPGSVAIDAKKSFSRFIIADIIKLDIATILQVN